MSVFLLCILTFFFLKPYDQKDFYSWFNNEFLKNYPDFADCSSDPSFIHDCFCVLKSEIAAKSAWEAICFDVCLIFFGQPPSFDNPRSLIGVVYDLMDSNSWNDFKRQISDLYSMNGGWDASNSKLNFYDKVKLVLRRRDEICMSFVIRFLVVNNGFSLSRGRLQKNFFMKYKSSSESKEWLNKQFVSSEIEICCGIYPSLGSLDCSGETASESTIQQAANVTPTSTPEKDQAPENDDFLEEERLQPLSCGALFFAKLAGIASRFKNTFHFKRRISGEAMHEVDPSHTFSDLPEQDFSHVSHERSNSQSSPSANNAHSSGDVLPERPVAVLPSRLQTIIHSGSMHPHVPAARKDSSTSVNSDISY